MKPDSENLTYTHQYSSLNNTGDGKLCPGILKNFQAKDFLNGVETFPKEVPTLFEKQGHRQRNLSYHAILKFLILFLLSFTILDAEATFSVTGISISPQSSTLTYGTSGTVDYTITLIMVGSGGGSTDLSLNWTLPSGVTHNLVATTPLTGDGQTVTFSVNTTNLTPAGNYPFSVTSSDGPRTSPNTFLEVDPIPISVIADDVTKTYGSTLTGGSGSNAFTISPSSLPNGDAIESVTIAYGTGASSNSAVNTYSGSVTPSAATGASFNPSNYQITYTAGDIIVDKASITITANDVLKLFGTALSGGSGSTAFTFSPSVLPNGETIVSITRAFGAGAAANSPVGNYPGSVTPSAATGGTFNPLNYQVTYVPGDITVSFSGTSTAGSSNLNPACIGSDVTLYATITSSLSTATGIVEFFDGATSLGTAPVVSTQASLTLSTLAVGSRNITAVYSGDANNTTSTSPVFIQEVRDNPTVSNAGPNQVICGTNLVKLAANSPASGTGAWTKASGTGGAFTDPANPGTDFFGVLGNSYTLRWTISNAPCTSSISDVQISFFANPTVNAPSITPVCHNSPVPAINFTGTGTGTTYSWTNSLPGIGLAASGTGNIASFTGVNAGATNAVAVVEVTPSANGCTGITVPFNITIKPKPVLTALPSSQTVCSGSPITSIVLSSSLSSGTNTFAWTRDNIAGITGSGGLIAFNGSGSTISGSFSSSLPGQGMVGFQGTLSNSNGCVAAPLPFSVTVNPSATINSIPDQTVCKNTATTAVNFSSPNASSYTWSNSNPSIGLGASGTGTSIAAFNGAGPGLSPVSGTITVTPVYTSGLSCNGTPGTFTITVNPIPVFSSPIGTLDTICSGSIFTYNPTTTATGVTPSFNWTRVAVSSNPDASGTGSVSETLFNISATYKNATYAYTVTGTNNGVGCTSNPVNVRVGIDPVPIISFSPSADQSICTGDNMAAVTMSSSGTGLALADSIRWLRTNIVNVSSPTLGSGGLSNPITGVLTNNTGVIRSTIFSVVGFNTTNKCASAPDTFIVQVNPPINSNNITPPQVSELVICGLTKKVTIVSTPPSGGSGSYSYQWQASPIDNTSFVNIPGATGLTLVDSIFNNTYYRRIVTSGGCSDTSNQYYVPAGGGGASQTVGTCTGGSGVDIIIDASYIGAVYSLERSTDNGATWNTVPQTPTFPNPINGDGDSIYFKNNSGTGLYRVRATIPGQCSELVLNTVTITPTTVPPAPSGSYASDNVICNGESTNLFGGVPAGTAVYWYTEPVGGTTLTEPPIGSGVPYSVSPTTTGKYYAKAEYTATGCKSSNRDSVLITVNPTPSMTSAASATSCSGSPVGLSFSDDVATGTSFAWMATDNPLTTGESTSLQTSGTLSNTIDNNSNATTTVTYSVTPTIPSTGCTGLAQTVLVSVDPRPVIANKDSTICSGSSFTISPPNPITSPVTNYSWSPPAGTGFSGGSAGSETNITGTLTNTTTSVQTATYTVTPSGGVCTGAPFTVTITINPSPQIANQLVSVCNGSFTIPPFTGTNVIPPNTTFSWPAPTGTNISGMAPGTNETTIYGTSLVNTAPSGSRTATYTVTPTAPPGLGGCPGNNFTVIATIHQKPSAAITGATTVCPGTSSNITFTGSNGTKPYTFYYNINGGPTDSIKTTGGNNSANLTTTYLIPGTFTYNLLAVSDNNLPGCQVTQTGIQDMTVTQPPVITPPIPPITACTNVLFSFIPINGIFPNPAAIVPVGTLYSWPAPSLPAGLTGASPGVLQPSFNQTLINNTSTVKVVNYTITPSVDGCPGLPFTVPVTIDPAVPANTAIWTGSVNGDWCNTSNWACGILPDANKNAIIPAGTPNSPIVNCVNAYVNDIDVKAGAILNIPANQELDIKGAIINTDPTRYILNGTVSFSGSNPQSIPAFAYNGLSIRGGGVKTLAGAASVSGELILINGVIVTTISNMLTIEETGTVTAGSATSYIQGPITRETNSTATYEFPVGNGSLRSVYVTPATPALSSYTVYYHPTAPTYTSILGVMGGLQINEYWDVTRNSGANAIIGLQYENPNNPAAWSSGFEPCSACNVAVAQGTVVGLNHNWDFVGGSAFGFTSTEARFWLNNGIINSRMVSNFGQFTFAYAYSVILPVTLVDFKGSLKGNNALLQWEFASSEDLAKTEIQHSSDGLNFSKLATVQASANVNTYNYTHLNLAAGKHYYRLLVYDKTGRTTFSKTILLVTGNLVTVIKGLRPTMVINETFVDILSAKAQTMHAILYDVTGRAVAEYKGKLQQGENSYRIPAGLLSHGIYTLRVQTLDGVIATLRFMKE